jgi:membrane-bound metal-dependent hydrolase YbcI (DUF457 family)
LDNITHTLVGVTLVRAGFGVRTAGATATMVLASNIPDIDIVAAFDGSVAYFAAHRGASHGPLGVLLLGALAALVVVGWRALRRQTRATAWSGAPTLVGVGIAGALLHVLMDLPTIYGTRLLSPFDQTWYSLDWLPIIDVYLWGALVLGLVAARLRPAQRQAVARAVLVVAVGIYATRALAHGRALDLAANVRADGVRSPCASAPVLTRHPTLLEAARAGPGACLQAAALPTFFSPFEWRLVRQQSDGYEMRDVRVIRQAAAGPSIFVPSESNAWVAAARQAPTARVFFNFSRFPATRSAALQDGTRRVRAMDIRFLGPPPRGLEQDPQTRAPFLLTVEVSGTGAVRAARLGP